MRDKEWTQLEEELLVLVLDNCSILQYYDARYYPESHRPPNLDVDKLIGKSFSWYATKLKIGTRTLMRIAKQACAKQLLEEVKVQRFRSFDTRYELTPIGEKIAKRLKAARTDGLPESTEDPLIKVLVRLRSPLVQEEPILLINKEECLTTLSAETLLREVTATEEWIVTRGDTVVVTVRYEDNGRKILVKGSELSALLYEKIKRLVQITLCEKDPQFTFVPHKPLPCKYLSTTKNLRTIRAKQMLKQWSGFKKPSFLRFHQI